MTTREGEGSRQVLQVIQAPQHRGAEVFALQLSRALRNDGWKSPLASLFPGDERYVTEAKADGGWMGAVSSTRHQAVLSWPLVRALNEMIAAGRYRIVQANGSATLKYLATAKLVARGRWRLMYRTIGMPSYWRRDPVRTAAYRWWFRQADLVVAVCRRAGDELVERLRLPARRVAVIPNGVDARPFHALDAAARDRVRQEAGVGRDDAVIAHVGSLTPEKNHTALMRAVAALRAHGLPARLWVVGDGPERPAVEVAMRSLGLEQITWLAGLRTDLPELLTGADVLALPSLTEGMPAVVIEAGLAGLPVVATDVGGIGEVVVHGETGFLTDPRDETALRDALARLIADPDLRRRMGQAGRRVCAAYEISAVARQYAAVYDRLLIQGLEGVA